MGSKIVRIVVWGAVAVAVVVVFYVRTSRMRVDRLIGEANALIEEGDNNEKQLGADGNLLLGGGMPKEIFVERASSPVASEDEFAGGTVPKKEVTVDRAKLEKVVAKTDEMLTKVVANFRAASAKFDEGRQSARNGVIAKYLELMSQAYQLRADCEEAHRKAAVILIDKSVPSLDEIRKKRGDLLIEAGKAESEFERLAAEAEKLHDANLGQFK